MPTAERAESLWFLGPHSVELREEPAPTGEVVARALASGVSQGTERLLYLGKGPLPFDPSLPYNTTYPCRYGYAWVGEVIESASRDHKKGDRVFALKPHGEIHAGNAGDFRAVPVTLPTSRATLLANAETAVNIVWDAKPTLGDRVAVIGGGVVGALTALALSRMGIETTLFERSESRRALLKDVLPNVMLAEGLLPPEALTLRTLASFDIAIDTSGHPAVLPLCVPLLRNGGRLVLASFLGTAPTEIRFGEQFFQARLELVASHVSQIPPPLRERYDYDRRFAVAASLLEEKRLDALIESVPFSHAAEIYSAIARGPEEHRPHLVFDYL